MASKEDLPTDKELMLPVLQAVDRLGGSATSRQIRDAVIEVLAPSEDLLAITYPARGGDESIYLDRDLELRHVGQSGDRGIDGIGTAPMSPVLSATVAVQAKRHDPTKRIGRDIVALFQRDANAAGAERAILVTLGGYTAAAREASQVATPTVDLIDGDRLCDLALDEQVGVRNVPQVDSNWFTRFETRQKETP